MKAPLRYTIPILLFLCLTAGFLACSDDPVDEDEGDQIKISIVSGNNQSERTGVWLPLPLTVQVRDALNDPVEGALVNFSTTETEAVVDPAAVMTDVNGYASTYFKLGSETGLQNVTAEADGQAEVFGCTAVAVACDEESPERICPWPAGHIFITTTSSSEITGSGSVLLDFDPATRVVEKVLETLETLTDVAFSPRGELFVTTNSTAYKVDPTTKTLVQYIDLPVQTGSEIEPNFGGVLVMTSGSACFRVGCSTDPAALISSFINVRYKNLAVDPIDRDFYIVTGAAPPSFYVHRNYWDGRGAVGSTGYFILNTGSGTPNGMCVDSTGVLYITIDGSGNDRSVARYEPGGTPEPGWFDFDLRAGSTEPEAGRWGDIAILGDKLYIIDTMVNRLVVLWTGGTTQEEKWFEEHLSDVYSRPGSYSERYGIAASSSHDCP
jgi:sugar lactone lactonase YvrE